MLWGSDYPHYEGTYPHSKLAIRHTFNDVTDDEARLMLGLNAAKLYDFDLEKLAPLVAEIGIRPEQVLGRPLSEDEFPEETFTMAFRR